MMTRGSAIARPKAADAQAVPSADHAATASQSAKWGRFRLFYDRGQAADLYGSASTSIQAIIEGV